MPSIASLCGFVSWSAGGAHPLEVAWRASSSIVPAMGSAGTLGGAATVKGAPGHGRPGRAHDLTNTSTAQGTDGPHPLGTEALRPGEPMYRDAARYDKAIKNFLDAAHAFAAKDYHQLGDGELMEAAIEAARADATTGEMMGVMKEALGWRAPHEY